MVIFTILTGIMLSVWKKCFPFAMQCPWKCLVMTLDWLEVKILLQLQFDWHVTLFTLSSASHPLLLLVHLSCLAMFFLFFLIFFLLE